MELKKDIIIVHFQEHFFNDTNQHIKNKVASTLQPLVDAALTTDIHVSFWEDNTVQNKTSVIPIPPLGKRVSQLDAPKGLLEKQYPLKGKEVILAGGWFGACINGAIETIMAAFFTNDVLLEEGELTIRMLQNGVYKESKLLSQLDNSKIINPIQSAFDLSGAITYPVVPERGLRYKIIRSKPQEILLERIVIPAPNNPTKPMFDIIFLLD
ncbi:MAG: hypothetical protein AAF617_04245 [Bacteroidota bacterium]